MSKKAFGGATIIYKATIEDIRKESVQDTSALDEVEDYITRPVLEDGETDAIEYFTATVDKNSYHTRSIEVLANCTVGLGMNFESGNTEKINKRLSNVNVYGFSFIEVINRVAQDHFLTGNGHLEAVPGKGGKIEELYFMPSVDVWRKKRIVGEEEQAQFYYINPLSGEKIEMYLFDHENIDSEKRYLVPFPAFTATEKFYGMPSWRGALVDIELDYYAVKYQQGFFINHGVPDMAVVVEGGKFDKETNETVQAFLQSNFKGMSNNNKVLYLPIAQKGITVKFEKLAMENKDQDASFQKLRNISRDNILSAHGVPPRLAGIVTAGQLGGGGEVEGQLKVFQEITISPKQKMFETKLNQVLSAMDIGDVNFTFQTLDTNIQEKRSEYYPKMVQAGIIPVKTAQEELGYNPDELEQEEPEETEDTKELKLVESLEAVGKALES